MKTTVTVDQTMLTELGISINQFQEAVAYALSRLTHPETGVSLYINSPVVTVNVTGPKVTTTIGPFAATAPVPLNYSLEERPENANLRNFAN